MSGEEKLDEAFVGWLTDQNLGDEAETFKREGIHTLKDLKDVAQHTPFAEFWSEYYGSPDAGSKKVYNTWKALWQSGSVDPAEKEVVIGEQQQAGHKGGICGSCQPEIDKIVKKVKDETQLEYFKKISKLQIDLRGAKKTLSEVQKSLHATKQELDLSQEELKNPKQDGKTYERASQPDSHSQRESPLCGELEALEKSLQQFNKKDHPLMIKKIQKDILNKQKQINDFERQQRADRRGKKQGGSIDDPMEDIEYTDSSQIDPFLASNDALRKENDALKNENDALKNKNDALKNENNVVKNEYDAIKKENRSLNKYRLDDNKNTQEYKKNLQRKDAELQVLNQKISQITIEIGKLKADNMSLEDAESRVTESEALHKRAKQKVQSKEQKIKQLERSVKEHQGKNRDLEQRLMAVEREMEAAQTETTRKSYDIRQLKEDLDDEKEIKDVKEKNIRMFFQSQSLDPRKVAQALHMEVQPLVLKQYNAFHIRSYITDIGFNEHDSIQIYKWWSSGHRENPELMEWLCASGMKLTTSAREIAHILYIIKGFDNTERLQQHALTADFGDDLHHVMSDSDIQKLEENCHNIRVKVSVDDWLADLGLANDGYADKFKVMKFLSLDRLQDTPPKKLDGILRQIGVKGAHKIRIKNSCLKLSSWIHNTVGVTISEEDARDVAAKFERVNLFTLWDLKQHLKQMTDDEKRAFFKDRCTSFKTRHAIKKALGLVESKSSNISNDRPNFGGGPSGAHSPHHGPVDGGRGYGGGRGAMGGHGHNQGYGLDQGFGGGAQFQHGGGGAGPNPGFGGGGSGGHNQYGGGYPFGAGGQNPRGGHVRGGGAGGGGGAADETISQRLAKFDFDYALKAKAERLLGLANIHTIQDLMSEAARQKKEPLEVTKGYLSKIKVAKRVKIAKSLVN